MAINRDQTKRSRTVSAEAVAPMAQTSAPSRATPFVTTKPILCAFAPSASAFAAIDLLTTKTVAPLADITVIPAIPWNSVGSTDQQTCCPMVEETCPPIKPLPEQPVQPVQPVAPVQPVVPVRNYDAEINETLHKIQQEMSAWRKEWEQYHKKWFTTTPPPPSKPMTAHKTERSTPLVRHGLIFHAEEVKPNTLPGFFF